MHSFRKLISLLLVAAMLFSLSCEAFAVNAGDEEGSFEDDPVPAGSGNVLTLPAALEVIEEEAFCGDESLEEVVIPYGATTIGPRAFAYSGLRRITIPDTVTEIAGDAFEGTDGLTIVSAGNCFACDYAMEHTISWEGDGSFYCNDQLANLKATRERLSELESIVPEEETFDLMSTEGVTDAEMLALIEDYNAFQLDMQESYNKYMDGLDELATISDKMADSVVNSNVQIDKNGASYADDGLRFSVPQELTELIGDDYTIGEVKTLENGDVQTELISNGQTCLLQSSSNGITLVEPNGNRRMIRLMAGNPSETAFDTIQRVVSDLQNWYSAFCSKLDELIDLRERNLTQATDRLTMYRNLKQNSLTLRNFEQLEAMELSCVRNVASTRAALGALRNASSVFSGFSLIMNGFSIADDVSNYKEMSSILTHGHPTENDAGNQQKLELAQDMLRDLDFARRALISHAASSAMSLVLDIADIVSNVTLLIPGVGASARVTVFAARSAFKVILGATDMAVGGLASVHVQRVKNADTELHKTESYSLSGVVTDSKTGAALAGVKVTLDGSSTDYTGADGAYIFENVPLGTHKLSFKKAYYITLSANVTVSSTNSFKYNARMVPQEDDEPISSDDFNPEFWAFCVKHYDQNQDRTLSRNEILAVTEIDIRGGGFSSLKGIRNFSNLTSLDCTYNHLTSLDLSGCSALTTLRCWNNQLTSLNLSGCSALTSLDCAHDQLTSLNLSGCSALTTLECRDNQLTSLDLSGCSALTSLDCGHNKLTSLDLSGYSALTSLGCDLNQLTSLNLSGCSKLNELHCGNNQLPSLDLTRCSRLTELHCENNQLTSLDLTHCSRLTILHCENNQFTNLSLSGFNTLTELHCENNPLTSLDLTRCSRLTILHCENNPLTSLNLSGCSELTSLLFSYKHLSSLNVSGCSMLTELPMIFDAPLTNLNASGCSKLTRLYCEKAQLTSLNVSGCSALWGLECARNQLTSLDLSGCSKLSALRCNDNQLTSLNLSDCSELTELWCYRNQLTTLDLSGCSALTELSCGYNHLTSLNLSGCSALTTLNCHENQLTSLNLSGYSTLTTLYCDDNQLTSLNLSGCSALTKLYCPHNQLTSLDLSGCSALTDMECWDNKLTSLNLSDCSVLEELACYENQLTTLDLSSCPNCSVSCDWRVKIIR